LPPLFEKYSNNHAKIMLHPAEKKAINKPVIPTLGRTLSKSLFDPRLRPIKNKRAITIIFTTLIFLGKVTLKKAPDTMPKAKDRIIIKAKSYPS
jgi:hypothetical protein